MESKQLNVLNEISRQKLINILHKIPGRKDLVIDPVLMKPLENFIGISALRSLNVEKVFKLHGSNIGSDCEQRVFLVSSDLVSAKHVCNHVNSVLSNQEIRVNFFVIVVPRCFASIKRLLEQEGVYEYVTVYSFQWELIPLDCGALLSLELPNFFRSLFVHGDQSLLPSVAKSIWSSFMLLGKPSTSIIIGNYSQAVYNMYQEYTNELGFEESSKYCVDCFILVDRDVDYVSPLLTPSTYAGLLDEAFNIKSGFVEINETLNARLENDEEVYAQIRDRNFTDVTSFVKNKAKSIQNEYERSQQMKLQEIKNYVRKQLQNVTAVKKSLSFHITACETIIKKLGDRFGKFHYIEDSMLRGATKREVITFIEDCLALSIGDKLAIARLICLLSLTQNGLTNDEINYLKKLFCNACGYDCLFMFYELNKLGLMYEECLTDITSRVASAVSMTPRKSPLHIMIQKLKLLPNRNEDTSGHINDISYVFNGSYIPAICQIVSSLIRKTILLDDLAKIMNSNQIKVVKGTKAISSYFVYYIGGISYAEVAAFKLLEKVTGNRIYLATTNTINGNNLIASCSHSLY